MTTLDWAAVGAYFALLLGLTWWSILRNRDTVDDYFLAGRHLGWVVVGASIFASNIGSEHLVGLAGSGATSGVALAHFELHAWCLLVLGWVMVPFYMRSGVYTMPEFLERRFSPAARWVLSLISLVAYVLTKMAVGIFAGGVVFGVLLPESRRSRRRRARRSTASGSDRWRSSCSPGSTRCSAACAPWPTPRRCRRRCSSLGSLLLTVFGLVGARRLERAARGARAGDVQPVEADRAGRRRGHVGAGQRSRTHGVVLQPELSVAGHAAVRADHRPLVLVHRSVHRAAHARRQRRARGAPGHDLRRVPQAAAALHLHRAGHDRRGAGPDRPHAAAGAARRRPTGRRSRRRRRRRFP